MLKKIFRVLGLILLLWGLVSFIVHQSNGLTYLIIGIITLGLTILGETIDLGLTLLETVIDNLHPRKKSNIKTEYEPDSINQPQQNQDTMNKNGLSNLEDSNSSYIIEDNNVQLDKEIDRERKNKKRRNENKALHALLRKSKRKK